MIYIYIYNLLPFISPAKVCLPLLVRHLAFTFFSLSPPPYFGRKLLSLAPVEPSFSLKTKQMSGFFQYFSYGGITELVRIDSGRKYTTDINY